jgi:hypothetical protein
MLVNYIEKFKSQKYIKESNVIIDNEYLDFLDYLKKFNVPVELYGTGGFKTVNHLFNEIKEGETVLTEKDGKLIREVNFVGARIIYKKEGSWIHLYEEKQIFKDGRVRRRNLPYSMAEKFKLGEEPKKVLIRGMKEEIDLNITNDQFNYFNKLRFEDNSDYPGITSFHTGYEFLVVLKDNQYVEEGYIERQSDKDVYFKWKSLKRG